MVESGDMEAGNLLSFVVYTVMIGGAIASLGSLYTTIAGGLGATERVKEILGRSSELDINVPRSDLKLKGNVSFNNVHFNYPSRPEVEVLSGINLKVSVGEKIALVGQSGSGKSTIVRLLMRFYHLNSGSIEIDGKNLEEYPVGDYRHNLGVVPQEVILFGGSIKENLLYGKPDATDAEIEAAADKANCLEFISKFPEGFDT